MTDTNKDDYVVCRNGRVYMTEKGKERVSYLFEHTDMRICDIAREIGALPQNVCSYITRKYGKVKEREGKREKAAVISKRKKDQRNHELVRVDVKEAKNGTVDKGTVMALRRAGWPVKKIAEDVCADERVVWAIIQDIEKGDKVNV